MDIVYVGQAIQEEDNEKKYGENNSDYINIIKTGNSALRELERYRDYVKIQYLSKHINLDIIIKINM